MCKPITLHQNKHGCISWCPECNYINVAFGTILFALTPAQFNNFRYVLQNDLAHCVSGKNCCNKTLLYNTDSRNVNIVLSYRELVQLDSLVNYASLLYDAYVIIYDV